MLPIITFDELQACPLKEALASVSYLTDYSHALSLWSKNYAEDSFQRKTLSFFSSICGMVLNTDNKKPVFKPIFMSEDGRSPLPEDVPTENFEPLFTFAATLEEQVLRARIMDILWVRRAPKRVEAAEAAITSYLECAKLLSYKVDECIPYLHRALNIAYELGKNRDDLRELVSGYFEQAVQHYSPQDLDGLHYNLFFVMAERNIGDQEKLYEIMMQAAAACESKSSFHLERMFLQLARMFAKNACHSQAEIDALLVKEAESYVKEANSREDAIAKAFFLEKALQAYRYLGGHDARIEELHKEMLNTQKRIPELLHEYEIPLPDMSDLIEKARQAVSGKEIFDALISFAFITSLFDPNRERTNSIKRANKCLLTNLCSQRRIDSNGKTISFSNGLWAQGIERDETAIYADMLRHSQLCFRIDLEAKIIPAFKALLGEHEISDFLLADIVKNNMFVPEGRELFFIRGIKAGFESDFVTASLFLIPQLENSFRNIMEKNDVITSKLTSTGIQREKDLNDVLDERFIQNMLGNQYIFTLKALLIEQEGANLRHRLAHGLAEYNQLDGGDASIYFWWIMVSLLLTSFVQQQETN